MDNAAIHKSDLIKDKINEKIAIIFNAPNTPDLNGIEPLFSKWKHLVYSKNS